ncbi:MAG: Zn-ribbon domain-containing OB-fold protein [Burkholderiaceae bacterium]
MVIVPKPDALTRPYWDAARAGRLVAQRCNVCSRIWHPPLPSCPACGAQSIVWIPLSGNGVIYSHTIIHHAAHAAVADRTPYLVALVTLDEGPRLVSNILDCPMRAVRIGMRVAVTFQEIAPDIFLPQFRPLEAGVRS